jgi:hypothetical protein
MIEHIDDTDEASFLAHWAQRVWDRAQLAQMEAIEKGLVNYAMTAWRSMNIDPPVDTLLYAACEEGPMLLTMNRLGEWRTNLGMPHRPPRAWMPAPPLPRIMP